MKIDIDIAELNFYTLSFVPDDRKDMDVLPEVSPLLVKRYRDCMEEFQDIQQLLQKKYSGYLREAVMDEY